MIIMDRVINICFKRQVRISKNRQKEVPVRWSQQPPVRDPCEKEAQAVHLVPGSANTSHAAQLMATVDRRVSSQKIRRHFERVPIDPVEGSFYFE
jgi:hypothetical protein